MFLQPGKLPNLLKLSNFEKFVWQNSFVKNRNYRRNLFVMKIKELFFVVSAFLTIPFFSVQAEEKDKHTNSEPEEVIHIRKMNEQVSELMADRVPFKKEIELKELATLNEAELEERENLMFPADELYGSLWENERVDPFRGKAHVEFPDSFKIDCSSFVYPIAIDSIAKVTSKFGPRRWRMHKGIDLKVLKGDTICSAFDGKVRIKGYERRGFGYYIVIRHPNGLETVYAHLSKIMVEENQIVHGGEPIGLGGSTGRSTGSHLHFETRFLGQALNPADLINFETGIPHQKNYVFHNVKINGRSSNVYASSNNPSVYHRIKSGETLGGIARRYGTTVRELCRLNGLTPTSILRIGQSIRCNAGYDGESSKKSAKSTSNSSAKKVTTTVVADPVAVADVKGGTSVPVNSGDPVYHRIKSGDTLGALAIRYGTSVSKLCEMNNITKNTTLHIGQSLRCH